MKKKLLIALLLGLFAIPFSTLAAEKNAPVRFAIVGLSHDHARGFIPSAQNRAVVLAPKIPRE